MKVKINGVEYNCKKLFITDGGVLTNAELFSTSSKNEIAFDIKGDIDKITENDDESISIVGSNVKFNF